MRRQKSNYHGVPEFAIEQVIFEQLPVEWLVVVPFVPVRPVDGHLRIQLLLNEELHLRRRRLDELEIISPVRQENTR
jgi:hypothetical protein